MISSETSDCFTKCHGCFPLLWGKVMVCTSPNEMPLPNQKPSTGALSRMLFSHGICIGPGKEGVKAVQMFGNVK